jgi:tocopherol O-methyltransferase
MPESDSARQINRFYTEADSLLERLWSGSSRMIHFGYQPNAGTEIDHDDSLIETVRQAALRLELKPGDLVLDAGCGIGGPAVWIAETYDVTVHGITNVELHKDKATELARTMGFTEDRVRFLVQDYTKTKFAAANYDAVVAIESACYATEKADFLKEMFRVLKPGGKISVLDAFRTKRTESAQDETLMESWLTGWGATEIDTIEEFTNKALAVGFTECKFEDLQLHFRASHFRCYKSARYLTPVLAILSKLGVITPTIYGYCRAARDAFIAAERGLCVQGIFSARKPG